MYKNLLKLPSTALFLALFSSACGVFGSDSTEVRLTNDSDVSFDQVSFFTPDGLNAYSDLAPGESSPFVTVSFAYGVTTTEVVVGADTVRLQVIDHVGDEPLDAGRYSYVLDLTGDPGARQLGQTLRRESR